MSEQEIEQALIALTKATDGRDRPVLLHSGSISAQSLRESTLSFMRVFDSDAVFFNGFDPGAPQKPAEVAAWRNLALLARATAAAVEAGL